MEAFGWPPTAHHGDLNAPAEYEPELRTFLDSRRDDLFAFLTALCSPSTEEKANSEAESPKHLAQVQRGSLIAVAINHPKVRFDHNTEGNETEYIQAWHKSLAVFQSNGCKFDVGCDWQILRRPQTPVVIQIDHLHDHVEPGQLPLPGFAHSKLTDWKDLSNDYREYGRYQLLLFRLTAARRTRQLVAVRRLLAAMFGGASSEKNGTHPVDQVLNELAHSDIRLLFRVAGGGYWMNRPLRDEYYSRATADMSPTSLFDKLRCDAPSASQGKATAGNTALDDPPPIYAKRIAAQLWMVFAEHDRWADWYYDQNHQHSSGLWQRLAFQRMDYDTATSLARLRLNYDEGSSTSLRTNVINTLWPNKIVGYELWDAEINIHKSEGCRILFQRQEHNASPARIGGSHPSVGSIISCCGELRGYGEKLKTQDSLLSFASLKSLSVEARIWCLQIALDAYECFSISNAAWGELFNPNATNKSLEGAVDSARDYCQNAIDNLHEWLSADMMDVSKERMHQVWLQICRARIEVMAARLDLKNAVVHSPRFDVAYLALDAARSFVKREPEHRRAIVELYAAQVTMSHAEFYYTKTPSSKLKDKVKRVEAIRQSRQLQNAAGDNKLQASLPALSRAYELLRKGRRNTRWWRFYYNLRARHMIWQLWRFQLRVGSEKIPRDSDDRMLYFQKQVVQVLQIIRSALSAIRHRANLQPEPVRDTNELHQHTRFPFQMWVGLYRVGRFVIEHRLRSLCTTDESRCTDFFFDQFRELTETLGFKWENDLNLFERKYSGNSLKQYLDKEWKIPVVTWQSQTGDGDGQRVASISEVAIVDVLGGALDYVCTLHRTPPAAESR